MYDLISRFYIPVIFDIHYLFDTSSRENKKYEIFK